MMKVCRYLLILPLMLASTYALADHNATDVTPASHKDSPFITTYCPAPEKLVKDPKTMRWKAPYGWKGFEQSFANKIKGFTGAQWQGINVGHTTCVYQGELKGTFPILLLYNRLSQSPSGGHWKTLKGHYSNCTSKNITDCPILIRKPAAHRSLIEQAEELRSDAPPKLMQGF